MWPKAIAQLVEVAPHITRLLPVADRFFQARASNDEAVRKALEQMSEVRGDLGRVTASHEGLYRQLNDLNQRLALIVEQTQAAKAAAEAAEERAAALEQRLSTSGALLAILLPLNVVLLALTILLLVRH
jgi:chromosome segregation ATPase